MEASSVYLPCFNSQKYLQEFIFLNNPSKKNPSIKLHTYITELVSVISKWKMTGHAWVPCKFLDLLQGVSSTEQRRLDMVKEKGRGLRKAQAVNVHYLSFLFLFLSIPRNVTRSFSALFRNLFSFQSENEFFSYVSTKQCAPHPPAPFSFSQSFQTECKYLCPQPIAPCPATLPTTSLCCF